MCTIYIKLNFYCPIRTKTINGGLMYAVVVVSRTLPRNCFNSVLKVSVFEDIVVLNYQAMYHILLDSLLEDLFKLTKPCMLLNKRAIFSTSFTSFPSPTGDEMVIYS